jgi:hypothetical protein
MLKASFETVEINRQKALWVCNAPPPPPHTPQWPMFKTENSKISAVKGGGGYLAKILPHNFALENKGKNK